MTLTQALAFARAMSQAAGSTLPTPLATVASFVEAGLGLVEKWRGDGRTPEEILAGITKLRALKLEEIDDRIDTAITRLPRAEPPPNPFEE